MILKKPYGFLIKHFRIINIFLLIPIAYVTLCFSDINTFLNRYVSQKYSTFETGIAGKYITLWLLITIIFLILVHLLIYGLMRKKKKDTRFYTFSIIYYFILFIFSLLTYNQFTSIELGRINTTMIGMYKDIIMVLPLIGIYTLVVTLFKGLGFNIKTLRFDQGTDLTLTDEDNEEIEIGGKNDRADLKKLFIHFIRETKYYIIENKFIVTCLLVLFLLILSSNIYINIGVYNKKYTSNENFVLNNMILSVKNSYITNTDQGGNKILENKYFLVVKLSIENNSYEPIKIDNKNFRIDINGEYIYPVLDQGTNFLDIGNAYNGGTIPPKRTAAQDKPTYSCKKGYNLNNDKCIKEKEVIDAEINHNYYCLDKYELNGTTCEILEGNSNYVIAYVLNKNQIKKTYEMKILNKMIDDIGELNPSYKIIKFKPENLLNKEKVGEINIGEEISFKNTLLRDSKVTIDSIYFDKSYIYEYESCNNNNTCITKNGAITARDGSTLVIIDDSQTIDKNTSFYKNTNKDLYKYFGRIEYKYGNKEYSTNLKDVTPITLKNKRIYEISSIATKGENKQLIISIRNKYFIIKFD